MNGRVGGGFMPGAFPGAEAYGPTESAKPETAPLSPTGLHSQSNPMPVQARMQPRQNAVLPQMPQTPQMQTPQTFAMPHPWAMPQAIPEPRNAAPPRELPPPGQQPRRRSASPAGASPPPLPPKPAGLRPPAPMPAAPDLQALMQRPPPQLPARPLQMPQPTWHRPQVPQWTAAAAPQRPAGMAPPDLRLYRELNLKLTDETKPKFDWSSVRGEMKPLGAGAFNTVYSVPLQKPDGASFKGVFKPLNAFEGGWVAVETGVPPHDPQIAMRNLATCAYAGKLGFDVVPETSVALLDVPDPYGRRQRKLGLVMEQAEGRTIRDTPKSQLDNIELAREVTKLQLLDHLCGQGDRHGNNYFVSTRPDGSVKVTGVDNDQCFGAKLTDPNGIRDDYREGRGFRGTLMPPVVDRQMADAILGLSNDDLQEMLGSKLSAPEVTAAQQRLAGVQNHIMKLQGEGKVLPQWDWSVTNHLSFDNSYMVRDFHWAQDW